MSKYYVVPIIDNFILFSYRLGKYIPIYEYMKKYYPELAKLEEERLSIICSGDYNAPFTKKQLLQLEENKRKTKTLSEKLGIPLHLLIEDDGKGAHEVVTHRNVVPKDKEPSFLEFREQPRNIFLNYYNGDYIVKVKKFMKHNGLKNHCFQVIQGGNQKVMRR